MEGITRLLERYKNFITPPAAAARAVRTAIAATLHIELPEGAIKVRSGIASVQADALYKTEILLNKDAIIAHTRTLVGDAVRDIR